MQHTNKLRTSRKQALFESRREREFYRYFEPIRALTEDGPPLCDFRDEASVRNHRPFSSPDRALTAFCQLGALRLGTRRAMLFFFDSNNAYVLAEATRSLSLVDDSVHDIEDQLWLGHSVIPRGYSICEETVCRLPSIDEQDLDSPDRSMIHVINDIDQDAQFCDRPFVVDGPKAKFYAGVPITTSKGVNIGAYCCLDDRKHDGLDAKGMAFLRDMAATVMTHLEMVRAKSESERGQLMVSGLGAFIEGAPSLQRWEEEAERRERRKRQYRPPFSTTPSTAPKGGDTTSTIVENAQRSHNADLVPSVDRPAVDTTPSIPAVSVQASQCAKTSRQSEDLREHLVSSSVKTAFQRAANLLREAVDVDGCAFLDATPGTYGGLVETHDGSDQSQTSDAQTSSPDATSTEGESQALGKRSDSRDAPCKVLAASHAPEHCSDHLEALQTDMQATNITEKFLRALMRRHPQGKIWNFNEEGEASSESELSDGSPASRSSTDSTEGSVKRTARRRRSRIDDGRELQRLFPGVRCLALVGMWDPNRGRWFSACAVWTFSPLRLFSTESELHYLSAYCDVVMAEVHRLEAINSDKAKSDFISSISHELRSPLHGILGSVEVLQDSNFDSSGEDLVSQIEICGRTLLDIVDHLLDYSKINHHIKVKEPTGERYADSRTRPRLSSNSERKARLGNMMVLDADVPLDETTEEVVETAVYSFCCSRGKQFILDRKVAVTLEIDRSAELNWRCKLPLGGWKRICINLVSNALKYTSEGFIHVSLRAQPIAGKRKRFNAVFQVRDSGRGMSKDFLENHLFKAFSQEDSLIEGTGLGMSLVAKIVKAMGGKVEVQSEKDVGTTMTVTVPLDYGKADKDEQVLVDQRAARTPLNDISIAILATEKAAHDDGKDGKSVHDTARSLIMSSIRSNCEQMGVNVVQGSVEAPPSADILLLMEDDYLAKMQSAPLRVDKPLLLLCNSAISARKLRVEGRAAGLTTQIVEYIAQPYGNERLIKAIKKCMAGPQDREGITARSQPATGALSDHQGSLVLKGVSDIDDMSGHAAQLPHRSKDDMAHGTFNDGSLQSPPVLSPSLTDGLKTPAIGDAFKSAPDDYLSARSRSTGDQSLSPRAVDSGSPKDPTAQLTTKSVRPSGLSLLLVDDNQINLKLLSNYAAKQGHHKIAATDGQQAVNMYKAACIAGNFLNGQTGKHGFNTSATPPDRPQVILMDINMPVLDGFEATRQIRAFEEKHNIKPAHIIALTGLGSASAQQEAFSSGVDLFLCKPVRLKELTKVLAEIKSSEKDSSDGATPA
ncbi:hypothetical protein BAUCODRAFT_88051 [Baudoinia panamericana UAMH 10762]|uniref:histidine kinase n=1 Tax=Baudoinia panamericana (strain UAMH 10762) TaxID=717646 RepID=M2NDM9_BAUPA|nr:uncharacterized protein BAUCODRAFT_88051 [Baudoinia panamericana UAMH 10762]EMC97329.1 hypothetical protein BAUCODRAFT_88051 [Baudoinia panamericana UAMH 10762]